MDQNNKDKGFSLDLNAEVARGTYSNLAVISHSQSEFVIDFATMLPGMPKPDITNRIVMTPENVVRLAMALQDNIMKYQHEFGEITLPGQPEMKKEENAEQKGDTFDLGKMGPFGNGNLS